MDAVFPCLLIQFPKWIPINQRARVVMNVIFNIIYENKFKCPPSPDLNVMFDQRLYSLTSAQLSQRY